MKKIKGSIMLVLVVFMSNGCVSKMLNNDGLTPKNENNATTEQSYLGKIMDKVVERIDNKTTLTEAKGRDEESNLQQKLEEKENSLLDKVFGSDTRSQTNNKKEDKGSIFDLFSNKEGEK